MPRSARSRRYSEAVALQTFRERFEYLKLGGTVGIETFGSSRYLNQAFYRSAEWRRCRREVMIRDNGCDLAIPGREIRGRIYIHHINPLQPDAVEHGDLELLDPENLICVSFDTHQAIHYGDFSLLPADPVERRRNDTCPWKETR